MGIVAGRQLLAFGHWLLARIPTLFQSTNGQLAKSQKPPFHKKTAQCMQAPGGPLAAKGGQSVSACSMAGLVEADLWSRGPGLLSKRRIALRSGSGLLFEELDHCLYVGGR